MTKINQPQQSTPNTVQDHNVEQGKTRTLQGIKSFASLKVGQAKEWLGKKVSAIRSSVSPKLNRLLPKKNTPTTTLPEHTIQQVSANESGSLASIGRPPQEPPSYQSQFPGRSHSIDSPPSYEAAGSVWTTTPLPSYEDSPAPEYRHSTESFAQALIEGGFDNSDHTLNIFDVNRALSKMDMDQIRPFLLRNTSENRLIAGDQDLFSCITDVYSDKRIEERQSAFPGESLQDMKSFFQQRYGDKGGGVAAKIDKKLSKMIEKEEIYAMELPPVKVDPIV